MSKAICVRFFVALALALALTASAFGQDAEVQLPPACERQAAEAIIFDTLVTRPLGLAAMVVGFAAAIVAYPFALCSHSTERVTQKLIVEPYEYTFKRPVGDENCRLFPAPTN